MDSSYFSPLSTEMNGSLVEPTHYLYSEPQDADMVLDQLRGMLRTERFYLCDHMEDENEIVHGKGSSPRSEWRRKICQWFYRVVDHFRMNREVVAVAMNLFDRFLSRHLSSDRSRTEESQVHSIDCRTYQLSAMTCLYIAIKTSAEQGHACRKRFRLSSFVELSRGLFSAADIEDMEVKVLFTLKWRVNTPSPMAFVYYVLDVVPIRAIGLNGLHTGALVSQVLEELSRYLTELSVCGGSQISCQLPSKVAAAAILMSLDLLNETAISSQERALFLEAVTFALGLHQEDAPVIQELRSQMKESVWPEMLFDACADESPILVARDSGPSQCSTCSSSCTYF